MDGDVGGHYKPFKCFKTTMTTFKKVLLSRLLWLLLPFCFPFFGKSQDSWDVVKLRGSIYTKGAPLKEGSTLTKTQTFTFSNTSDVLLVRQNDQAYIVKPPGFATQVRAGKPIQNGSTSLEQEQHRWTAAVFTASNLNKIGTESVCDNVLFNMPVLSHPAGMMCDELEPDDNWASFKQKSLPNTLYPKDQFNTFSVLASPNCAYKLYFTQKGNLELVRTRDQQVIWRTDLPDSDNSYAILSESGALTIVDATGQERWSSGTTTQNCQCSTLFLSNEGNLQLNTPSDEITWQTRTWGGLVNTSPYGHAVPENSTPLDLIQQFTVQSVSDGMLLDVALKNSLEGALKVAKGAPGAITQIWTVSKTPDRRYRKLRSDKNQFLSVSAENSSGVFTRTFSSEINQEWDIVPADKPDVYYIRNINGLYLENSSTSKGKLVLAAFNNQNNQRWRFTVAP
jgi:hypothetical protein